MALDVILIDVGHSRIKAARWIRCGEIEVISDIPHQVDHALIASVSQEMKSALPSSLLSRGREIRPVDVPVRTDYDIDKIGVDRLLAVLAGVKMFPERERIVVIDAGTLTTIEFIENGRHRGGIIYPSVLDFCGRCSDVIGKTITPVYSKDAIWGVDTETAVGSGIMALFSPIKVFSPQVVLLGGGRANTVLPVIESLSLPSICVEPNLVLIGLSYLVD